MKASSLKRNQRTNKPKEIEPPHYIVGIGASAGGLEALRSFFGAIKEPIHMSYIVVQHLAPAHRSRLVELIAHSTTVQVREVEEGMRPEPGVAYITPPNKDIFLEKGVLRLRPPHMQVGPKPSIDEFFKSLAFDAGRSAIAIVLSGTGSDGSHGIRFVKAEGGIVIAQKVESAKYDGMPRAAKNTGLVDYELTPEEIAVQLAQLNYARISGLTETPIVETDPYSAILRYVDRHSGVDFSLYKQNTIKRRLLRRVQATQCEDLKDYYGYLREHPKELNALSQDILISVTAFFRDIKAFQALRVQLSGLIRGKQSGESFRCWVVGCATGEEAYSVAIMVSELCEKLDVSLNIQIFATDLDEKALVHARKAIYPGKAVADMDRKLRDKYFTQIDDRFQVKRSLREIVVFAKHNVCEDPPFLNLDLLSCRNVLIYFTSDLQVRVFSTMFYSLRKDGLLFLGKSETPPASTGQFNVVDKNAKIYSRGEIKAELPRHSSHFEAKREARLIEKERDSNLGQIFFEAMVVGFAPNSVMVDQEMNVRHVYGNAGSFLNLVAGEATFSLNKLLPQEWANEANSLVQRAAKQNKAVSGRQHVWKKKGGKSLTVQMVAVPLHTSSAKTFIVNFVTAETHVEKKDKKVKGVPTAQASKRLKQAERELNDLREQLQTVIEEQETTNEELQSLNEELQSANEELQSSNEELETANEELQSSNEELTTLNQELNVKSAEILALNQTLNAVQNAMIYPIVTLDKSLRLMHFNPAARFLLHLSEQDVGTSIKSLPEFSELVTVTSSIDQVMATERESSLQLKVKDRSFEVQIQVFHGVKGKVDGCVISFVDNTEIVTSLQEAKLIKQRLSDILDNTPAMALMKDTTGVITYANRRFCRFVQSDPQAIIGLTDEDVFGSEVSARIRENDVEVIRSKKPIQVEEDVTVNGTTYTWASSKFPLLDSKGRVHSVCTISLDISDRIQREKQLELFRSVVSSATDGIVLLEKTDSSDYITMFVSKELGKSFDVKPDALLNLDIRSFFRRILTNSGEAKIAAHLKAILSESTYTTTIEVPMPKDGPIYLELRSRHPGEQDRHMVLTFTNVTQQVLAQKTIESQQDELTRFGRYAALGEIAAGIAHEINTPLNVIITKTDLIRRLTKMEKLEPIKVSQVAVEIDQMIKNISSIVVGLKSLVAKDSTEFERTNMNQLIEDTLKVCSFRIQREGIELITKMPEERLYVDCHAVQISQILINLINNSVDAIGSSHDKKWIRVELHDGNDLVEIVVTDSGKSIDPGLAEKIMTPFFTTKKDKNGTGIGLSLSRTIAQRHRGNLTLDLKHKNTSFRIELPKRKVAHENT